METSRRGGRRSRDWLEGKRRQGPALISFKSIHSRSDNLGRPIRLVLGLEFQFYWTRWSADTCFFRDTPRSIHSLKLVPNERSLNSACGGKKLWRLSTKPIGSIACRGQPIQQTPKEKEEFLLLQISFGGKLGNVVASRKRERRVFLTATKILLAPQENLHHAQVHVCAFMHGGWDILTIKPLLCTLHF